MDLEGGLALCNWYLDISTFRWSRPRIIYACIFGRRARRERRVRPPHLAIEFLSWVFLSGKLRSDLPGVCLFSSRSLSFDLQPPTAVALRFLYLCCGLLPCSVSYLLLSFPTFDSTRWAKLPRQAELVASLGPNTRNGSGAPVRDVVMAEKKSRLALTGAIIRLLRGLRLFETGLRIILSEVLEVRGRLGMTRTAWNRKAGLGRRGGCVRSVSRRGMER